ncbi:MAG: DUF2892 domain-containing protein [Bacteroidales bacterium]|nr:DUF2892 domain-containing protein [Bacteroidales bacterium]HPD95732.1 DUF2892 domain-containing protein [Tenuifilaceae bacterium]HRX31608.1 DUF2892 domain-containing protein [Tenuifilaceae bacterium]
MKKNVGKVDMIVRIIIAIVIAGLGFYYRSWWGLIAIVPLLTGLLRFCPLYLICGIKTCPKKN